MPTTDLVPGAVVPLGQLRPGDAGETLNDPDCFVVVRCSPGGVDIRTSSRLWEGRSVDLPVRYLGPGSFTPSRIVTEGGVMTLTDLQIPPTEVEIADILLLPESISGVIRRLAFQRDMLLARVRELEAEQAQSQADAVARYTHWHATGQFTDPVPSMREGQSVQPQ